ncbi:MAG TPA: DUF58 domain-containing protein [Gemmatimonadaceae bacterium]|nr:DUF58 domain-containing protein [Gemmatimonadaceae bacterium]
MSVWRRAVSTATSFLPTRRLAVAMALLAPLWLLSWWSAGFVVAAAATVALVVAIAVDVALLPETRDLDVEREAPFTLGVGDAGGARYVVRSHWGRPLHVTLFDALPATHVAASGARHALELPPRGTGELSFTLEGRTRGEAPLGPVALRVFTPIGFVARTLRYQPDDRIVVAPSLAGVRRFRWLAVHQRLAAAGVRDARRRGEGRSFARLRDYVPGDDPRHIDWKATARRGHTITREFTIEQSQTVYVLVDAGRSMTQFAGEFPRFEYALSAALVLADVAASAGDRVGAMVFDDRIRALVPAQRGVAALQAMRAALVPVQPSLAEPDYAAAFRALAQRQRKRALIVLITDVLEPRAARALLAHLTHGVSRHLAVVVALRNEALLAAAVVPAAGNAEAVYESAAAAELLAERATALQRMRDAGVVVLDVAPDAMAAAVVSQYLELKARGAL